jgi:acetyl esterase/lipase
MKFIASLALFTLTVSAEPIRLWPAAAPGETASVGEEKDQSKPGQGLVAGKPVIRTGNVSDPTLTVYSPAKDKDTGTAIVVCPGGGYSILAYDLEGAEVCEWLNSIGVTGILVKYRVPARKDRPRFEAPLQDAQRAISLTRQHAAKWGINPQRIGVLGFSAGGHLAAIASNSPALSYSAIDAADTGFKPDFAVLIYPAYLTSKEQPTVIVPELPVSEKTPPTFIAMSQDDPVGVEGALHYSLALKKSKVPFEMHIYPVGGHGYGLRRTDKLVTSWPDRVADWMQSNGWLKK